MMVKLFLSSTSNIFVIAMLCIAIGSFLGCGEGKPPAPTGSLSGMVFSGKESVPKCRVKIYNKQTLDSFMKAVSEEGKYEFEKIPLGDYLIAVVQEPWYEASEPPFDKRIPRKYRDLKTSGFSVLVEEGPNEFDIKMKK